MHITKCKFVNCQSITDKELSFSSGLNVLSADNSSGKSVFFKMLKTSCGVKAFSTEDLEHLITYGEPYALALFYMNDNSVGGVMISKRSIVYLYGDSDQSIGKYDEPHPNYIRNMSIVMDPKEGFILNVLDPDQELIFVSSKLTTNFTVVKLISSHEKLEQLILNNDLLTEELTGQYKTALDELERIQIELDNLEYVDLTGMEEKIEKGSQLLPVGRVLSSMFDLLDKLTFVTPKDTGRLLSFLDMISPLQEVGKLASQIKQVKDRDFSVLEWNLDVCSILNFVNSLLNELYISKEKLESCAETVSLLESELSKTVQIVDCPVKGRVFYFEDGGCLACSLPDNQ